jgi:hypothetical protein
MKLFPARYDGECSRCDSAFYEDDMIGYDDEDELCCEDCLAEDEAEIADHAEAWKNFPRGKS